jgi:peptide chain release factor
MISRDRIRQVIDRMTTLGIHPDDLEESFIRGSGAGGQKINKTSSTVVLRHTPTGLEVRCQKERSLTQNRFHAREDLCEKIETLRQQKLLVSAAARAKKRALTRKRSPNQKRIIVEQKRRRSDVKKLRNRPGGEE